MDHLDDPSLDARAGTPRDATTSSSNAQDGARSSKLGSGIAGVILGSVALMAVGIIGASLLTPALVDTSTVPHATALEDTSTLDVASRIHTSVEGCTAAGGPPEQCLSEFTVATTLHADMAPTYPTLEACTASHGPRGCEAMEQPVGPALFGPVLMGYAVGDLLHNGEAIQRVTPKPLYSTAEGAISSADGVLRTASITTPLGAVRGRDFNPVASRSTLPISPLPAITGVPQAPSPLDKEDTQPPSALPPQAGTDKQTDTQQPVAVQSQGDQGEHQDGQDGADTDGEGAFPSNALTNQSGTTDTRTPPSALSEIPANPSAVDAIFGRNTRDAIVEPHRFAPNPTLSTDASVR